jgi:putative hemolysin
MRVPEYVIVETVFGAEYKIGMISHRFADPHVMYMLLADTYYVGDPNDANRMDYRYLKKSHKRTNRFNSYELAVKALQELEAPVTVEVVVNVEVDEV